MPTQRWVRIIGDGSAFAGPCLLHQIIFWPDVAADYVDIYDGRDATSGKKFARIEADIDHTIYINLDPGVPFDLGIYVDGIDAAVETTLLFTPLTSA